MHLATWLNDLDPVALKITDTLKVRWYGLAYAVGWFVAIWVATRFAKRGLTVLPESKISDLIVATAIFGIMLGGRLGYMLFYSWDEFVANPLMFFKLTQGGMAFHGAAYGTVIFTWIYAKRNKVSWTGIGDIIVVPAPLGIFLGRVANFINGELWGAEAPGLAWGVKFPQEAAREGIVGEGHEEIISRLRHGDTELREELMQILPDRHPSQLYEAVLEGLVLFAILYFVRSRWKNLPHGVLTGLFFIFYAIFRIAVEFVRVPDHPDAPRVLGWMTPGQVYSFLMIPLGLAFLLTARRRPWTGQMAA